ncbi:PLAC8 family protein [Paraphaeosphaeria minitans]|uniref:PLAC8 family protein n=1 Tax=Paraphaeosphaeria minitans TaxID=565426 RepID=A0A9P6GJW9_9PLEO|nr:PLAC8 family protein [Paraphaeosphaeria minitans]
MEPRQNQHQHQSSSRSRSRSRQHQRFSWQMPPSTPPEEPTQAPQRIQQPQHTTPLNTNIDARHNRVFSYAQTPAEHLAFQYIPSPTDPVPPLPHQSPTHQSQSPTTPIDPRPQSVFQPVGAANYPASYPKQPVPQTSYQSTSPAYEEKPSVSPLSPQTYHPSALPLSPVSPAYPVTPTDPPRIYQQQHQQQYHAQHARNFSNLSPLNTNMHTNTNTNMSLIPPMPAHADPTLAAPLTPSSIRKNPADFHPQPPRSYAHEAYSPHNSNVSATQKTPGGVFSPDSAHGPNGLDFALHQPGQIAHPNMDLSPSGAKRAWSSSLCTPSSDSLTGLFCPCILYGRTAHRLSQKSAKHDPTDLLGYSATNAHCVLMAASCGLWWVYPTVQRARVRHVYKLEGDMAGDCVRGVCCCCCVAVQNEREVRAREEAKRQRAGPAAGYQSVGQMAYVRQQ